MDIVPIEENKMENEMEIPYEWVIARWFIRHTRHIAKH